MSPHDLRLLDGQLQTDLRRSENPLIAHIALDTTLENQSAQRILMSRGVFISNQNTTAVYSKKAQMSLSQKPNTCDLTT
jgi:hypothetical protein